MCLFCLPKSPGNVYLLLAPLDVVGGACLGAFLGEEPIVFDTPACDIAGSSDEN